jgi:hypothetical protein
MARFNTKKFYVMSTLHLCVLYGSQNSDYFPIQHEPTGFYTETESVYSAVRTESLYKTDTLRLYRVKHV